MYIHVTTFHTSISSSVTYPTFISQYESIEMSSFGDNGKYSLGDLFFQNL